MINEALLFYAKYPFTQYAKKYINSKEIEINNNIIEKAEQRVITSIKESIAPNFAEIMDSFLEEEIVVYAVSRMIVSALDSKYFSARYAVAESKRMKGNIERENEQNFKRILKDLNLNFEKKENYYLLHFAEYLKSSPGAPEYFLINKELNKGFVKLTKQELTRVAEEAIREKIEKTLPKKQKIPEVYKEKITLSAEKVLEFLPKPKINEINFKGDIAPCMKKLMEDLKESKNLSHHARWSLAIYLHKIGKTKEEILNLFSNSPDFNLNITEYQTNYIISKDYSMPSCTTLKTYGLCINECGCFNPLKYVKRFDKNG